MHAGATARVRRALSADARLAREHQFRRAYVPGQPSAFRLESAARVKQS